MRRRATIRARAAVAAVACVLGAAAYAAPAGAVTITLGPTDLSASDSFAECDLSCSTFRTFVPTAIPGGLITTPADGTITSWRVKGAPPTRLRLRVVEHVGGGQFRGVMTSGVATQSDGMGSNLSAIHIGVGQQIGVDVTSNFPTVDPSVLLGDATVPGGAWSGITPGMGDNATAAQTEAGSGSLPLVNATVELFKPLILHMTSTSGPVTGGDVVVLTGQHLAFATGVRFGSLPAAQVIKADNNQVIAVAPPHPPGVVEVTVETAGGSSIDSTADRYEYFPVPPPDPEADVPPRLWGLKLAPKRFAAAGKGPSARAAAARGALVSYFSSEPARTRFTVQRRLRRSGRYVKVPGAFRRRTVAGANSFRFSGRMRKRALAPGRYRLVAKSFSNRKASKPVRRSFRVVRKRGRARSS